MTLGEALERVRSYRTLASTEIALQDHLARIFTAEGIAFEREYPCGAAGRIDFYLPTWHAGLEVKIAGSPAEVLRQLHRYAGVAEIARLVLFTSRARHSQLPPAIGDVPLDVVCPWEGGL